MAAIVDADALNYPYIRIRDVDWLKRTLLLFPTVVRMTPLRDAPADDPEVRRFTQAFGRRGPLLRNAEIFAPHVEQAQLELIAQLSSLKESGEEDLLRRFGAAADRLDAAAALTHSTLWERRLAVGGTFQIHRYKMFRELSDYLESEGLAWAAGPGSDGPDYLEMHPKLGEAVMATMAIACAENEGLQVVTEFPELHGRLIGTPREQVLRTCLGELGSARPSRAERAAEILVYRRCDVSSLTAERIAALKSERDALAAFRMQLEQLVTQIPEVIEDRSILEARINDALNDMFRAWRADQANLSNYARRIFGQGSLREPEKLVEKLVESAASPETARSVALGGGAGAVNAPVLGGLTIGIAAGAAAGFAIAVVFRAVRTWHETKTAEATSPYRYLTSLAREGVAFSLTR